MLTATTATSRVPCKWFLTAASASGFLMIGKRNACSVQCDQHTGTHCSTLQHTAGTLCNALFPLGRSHALLHALRKCMHNPPTYASCRQPSVTARAILSQSVLLCPKFSQETVQMAGEPRRAGVGLVLEARGRGPSFVAELAPGVYVGACMCIYACVRLYVCMCVFFHLSAVARFLLYLIWNIGHLLVSPSPPHPPALALQEGARTGAGECAWATSCCASMAKQYRA